MISMLDGRASELFWHRCMYNFDKALQKGGMIPSLVSHQSHPELPELRAFHIKTWLPCSTEFALT